MFESDCVFEIRFVRVHEEERKSKKQRTTTKKTLKANKRVFLSHESKESQKQRK